METVPRVRGEESERGGRYTSSDKRSSGASERSLFSCGPIQKAGPEGIICIGNGSLAMAGRWRTPPPIRLRPQILLASPISCLAAAQGANCAGWLAPPTGPPFEWIVKRAERAVHLCRFVRAGVTARSSCGSIGEGAIRSRHHGTSSPSSDRGRPRTDRRIRPED